MYYIIYYYYYYFQFYDMFQRLWHYKDLRIEKLKILRFKIRYLRLQAHHNNTLQYVQRLN